jgi:D-inositol-3-phosphate glycosyltransferase
MRGLAWRLRAGRRLLGREPATWLAEMLAPAPTPSEEPRADGRLDAPGEGTVVERGAFTVAGWSLFPSGPTARVEVWLGEHRLGLAQLGVARPDLQARLEFADAAIAGFSLTADLGRVPVTDGAAVVRVVARSVAGEKLELPAATIELVPAPVPRTLPSAPPPPPTGGQRAGRRLLVCTHQLCLGGASRYLLELLQELLRLEAVDPVVISPIGGPLRPRLEALGVPVHVSGGAPLDDLGTHQGRVEEILAWAAPQGFELALVNTASPLTLVGAEVAGRLGVPAIWAIHESFEPAVLWSHCSPEIRLRAEETLGQAALGVFQAEATARIFEPLLPDRRLTIPYGMDLAPIDALRAGFDRAAARRGLGIQADAELILCVGTIEPRKAQAPLAQAFAQIADDHPRARLALAGAGDTPDSRALAAWVEASGLAGRVELVPTTPEIQQWYGVSDLVVCPSRIESLPRAVIEAMAWERPVLATSVFGLPELIEHGSTGWLCEAGDTGVLAAALDRALDSGAAERSRIGRAGRALIERRHDIGDYGREIAGLLELAAAGVALSGWSPAGAGSASAPGSRRG